MSKRAISKRLRVLEETGVLRHTIEIRTHRISIQPGVLSEGADWMDRKRVVVGAPVQRRRRVPEGGQATMKTPPIVSPQEWNAAREELLVEEKKLTRARDALAAIGHRTQPGCRADGGASPELALPLGGGT